MAKPRITHEELKKLLDYDPQTGIFTWRPRVAGHLSKEGYIIIGIGPRYYKGAHLAYFYMTGQWPEKEMMDHWDGNRSNNAFTNLRPVTRSENLQNQHRPRSDNRAGFMGVGKRKHQPYKPWRARITINGVRKHLGDFSSPELAYEAYLEAKKQFHPRARINTHSK